MAKKIKVVNLENNETKTDDNQPTNIKVEFDEFAQIQNEIKQNQENPVEVDVEDKAVEQSCAETSKPKVKRATKRTSKTETRMENAIELPIVEEVKPEPPPIQEVKPVEEVKPQNEKKIKTVELVSCPDCQKEMTKTTLRYSHAKNCIGKPIVREEMPVKRRAPLKVKQEQVKEKYISIPEEILQQEINKRVREQKEARIKAKAEKIKKLAANIV